MYLYGDIIHFNHGHVKHECLHAPIISAFDPEPHRVAGPAR